MAIQQVYVYAFTINLKSKKQMNEHIGTKVLAIGATAAAAQQVLEQQFGGDLAVPPAGGVQVYGPAYTTLA